MRQWGMELPLEDRMTIMQAVGPQFRDELRDVLHLTRAQMKEAIRGIPGIQQREFREMQGEIQRLQQDEERALQFARIQRVQARGGPIGPRVFGGGRPGYVRPPHGVPTSMKVASSLAPISVSILLSGSIESFRYSALIEMKEMFKQDIADIMVFLRQKFRRGGKIDGKFMGTSLLIQEVLKRLPGIVKITA